MRGGFELSLPQQTNELSSQKEKDILLVASHAIKCSQGGGLERPN